MYIEIGPASLVVNAEKDNINIEPDRVKVEDHIKETLKAIGNYLPILKQKAYKIKRYSKMPPVVKNMIEAVKIVDEKTLTPMASVAGAVSDEIKDFLKGYGFDYISVNNGGDISVYNRNLNKQVRVSIGHLNKNIITPYIINIKGIEEYGIATSGLGGRSLTLGLAEIGTVVARTSAIADAAATFICNETDVISKNVIREKACIVEPATDIPEEYVTLNIDKLSQEEANNALQNGLDIAYNLLKQNIILDALIYLKGNMVTTITGNSNIKLEVLHGN